MTTIEEIKRSIAECKEDLRLEYGVKEIGIFGSYAKGKQKTDSDLDILIEFERPIGFVRLMRLEDRLSRLSGVKVEIVTRNALKPYIGRRILEDVVYV